MKVKILVPFRFEVDHKAVEFLPPGVADLPEEAVAAFVNAGYAAYVEDDPAVKVVNKPKSQGKVAMK